MNIFSTNFLSQLKSDKNLSKKQYQLTSAKVLLLTKTGVNPNQDYLKTCKLILGRDNPLHTAF